VTSICCRCPHDDIRRNDARYLGHTYYFSRVHRPPSVCLSVCLYVCLRDVRVTATDSHRGYCGTFPLAYSVTRKMPKMHRSISFLQKHLKIFPFPGAMRTPLPTPYPQVFPYVQILVTPPVTACYRLPVSLFVFVHLFVIRMFCQFL